MYKLFPLLRCKAAECGFFALLVALPLVGLADVGISDRASESGRTKESINLRGDSDGLGGEEPSGSTTNRNEVEGNFSGDLSQLVTLLERNTVVQDQILQALLDQERRNAISNQGSAVATFPVWTSILLGCVAVIVTTLGVGLAIFSFFGYRETMRRSSEIAENTSAAIAREEIVKRMENGDFKETIEEAIDRVAFRGFQGEMEEPTDP